MSGYDNLDIGTLEVPGVVTLTDVVASGEGAIGLLDVLALALGAEFADDFAEAESDESGGCVIFVDSEETAEAVMGAISAAFVAWDSNRPLSEVVEEVLDAFFAQADEEPEA